MPSTAKFDLLLPHTRRNCSEPVHSAAEWSAIQDAQAHRCFYCSEPVNVGLLTKDHLWPICTGGCTCIGNLVGACRKCNSMKRMMTVLEFLHARPSFLLTMGEFSTRILLLNREAFFWAKLRPRLRELALSKRMPPTSIPAENRQAQQAAKVNLHLQRNPA